MPQFWLAAIIQVLGQVLLGTGPAQFAETYNSPAQWFQVFSSRTVNMVSAVICYIF